MFTLGEAARQCGVAKGTVSKAIRSGKLSATRNEDGSFRIDAAELARYLEANGHRFRAETVADDRLETRPETSDALSETLVAELRAVIADLRTDRDNWRAASDHWRAAFESTQRLLPAPPQPRARWLAWLRRTG